MKAFRIMKSSEGMILVSALLVLLALTTLGIVIANTTTSDIRLSANHRDSKQAYYAAEAGAVLALEEALARDVDDLLKGPDGVGGTNDDGLVDFACCGTQAALGDNTSSRVTIQDDMDETPNNSFHDSNGRVFLRSEGFAPLGGRWQMEMFVRKECEKGNDGNLRAAITANGPINSTGNLIIDGRDHDLNGNLIPLSGKLGVSTKSTYVRQGSSTVGGTNNSLFPPMDIAPAKKDYASIVEQNATWEAPPTPEAALGMSAGKLRQVAQSGRNGSQYTTDPDTLTMPISGVTYVELPGCTQWNPARVEGEGVLVVHNEDTCATVKNFHAMSYFGGILIADDLIHLDGNGALIGAIFVLTQSPSEGNAIGNGTLDVLFSRQAIQNALDQAASCTVKISSWNSD